MQTEGSIFAQRSIFEKKTCPLGQQERVPCVLYESLYLHNYEIYNNTLLHNNIDLDENSKS